MKFQVIDNNNATNILQLLRKHRKRAGGGRTSGNFWNRPPKKIFLIEPFYISKHLGSFVLFRASCNLSPTQLHFETAAN